MMARVYLLLDVVDGKAARVALTLGHMPGVAFAECLEGRPDVMAMLQAPTRAHLAELLMPVLAAVDGLVENLSMMVARDGAMLPAEAVAAGK